MRNKLNDLIATDLYRVYGASGKKALIKAIVRNPGFRYIYILRKCQFYNNKNKILLLFYSALLKKYQYKFGIEIPRFTQIGKGFYIGHIGGITVNGKAKIGDNVNVLKGVLIGYNPRGKNKGCPNIGNSVWIGPNSNIIGNVNIEDNVIIAPGAFVNFDVPKNSIVIGNPGKIIYRENTTEGYINYTV